MSMVFIRLALTKWPWPLDIALCRRACATRQLIGEQWPQAVTPPDVLCAYAVLLRHPATTHSTIYLSILAFLHAALTSAAKETVLQWDGAFKLVAFVKERSASCAWIANLLLDEIGAHKHRSTPSGK